MADGFDILAAIGQELPRAWRAGTANSGSTTTIQDSLLGGADNSWNNGTALILRDAGGLGAAPEGESRIILDYDAKGAVGGDGQITVTTAFSGAVAAGDIFGIISPRFPRTDIYVAVNDALAEIKLPEVDDTSLLTAANDKTYALPTGVSRDSLLQVWIAQDTAEPFNWRRLYKYWVDQDADVHTLRLFEAQTASRALRLVFWQHPAAIWSDTAILDRRIDPELIKWMSLVKAVERNLSRFSRPPDRLVSKLNLALRKEARAKAKYMPTLPQDTPELAPTVLTEEEVGGIPLYGEV